MNLLHIKDCQGVREGMVVEHQSYGTATITNCHADDDGLVCALTAKLHKPSRHGNDWLTIDLTLIDPAALTFHGMVN